MKVLIIRPMEIPVTADLDGSLETLQKTVGGYIECVYPWDDPAALICNEEGKINGLALNRAVIEGDAVTDIIAGTFIIAGLDGDGFGSLTESQIERYSRMFKDPEIFFITPDGGINAVRIEIK